MQHTPSESEPQLCTKTCNFVQSRISSLRPPVLYVEPGSGQLDAFSLTAVGLAPYVPTTPAPLWLLGSAAIQPQDDTVSPSSSDGDGTWRLRTPVQGSVSALVALMMARAGAPAAADDTYGGKSGGQMGTGGKSTPARVILASDIALKIQLKPHEQVRPERARAQSDEVRKHRNCDRTAHTDSASEKENTKDKSANVSAVKSEHDECDEATGSDDDDEREDPEKGADADYNGRAPGWRGSRRRGRGRSRSRGRGRGRGRGVAGVSVGAGAKQKHESEVDSSASKKPRRKLQRHNESEIRRRTKINSGFQVLSGMISKTDPPRSRPKIMSQTLERMQLLENRINRLCTEYNALRVRLGLGRSALAALPPSASNAEMMAELDEGDEQQGLKLPRPAPLPARAARSRIGRLKSKDKAESEAAHSEREGSSGSVTATDSKTPPPLPALSSLKAEPSPGASPAAVSGAGAAATMTQPLLENAFRDSVVAIGITSTSGVLIEANPALCMLLGYTREEIIGEGMMPFVITHPESLALTFQYMSLLLHGNQRIVRVDAKYIAKDGRQLLARLTVWLTRDNAGRPQNLFNVIEPLQLLLRPARALASAESYRDA